MKIIFLLLIILLCSCKSQHCTKPNDILISEFENNLKIVKMMQKGRKVKIVEYRNALLYLSNKTGIMTKADYSSTIGYQNESDYQHDINAWKDWLNRNKCLE